MLLAYGDAVPILAYGDAVPISCMQDAGDDTFGFHVVEVSPTVHKYLAQFSLREWLTRLQGDESFIRNLVSHLQKSPFQAFFFEMPPTDLNHLDRVSIQ
jgi:hypothetical protein